MLEKSVEEAVEKDIGEDVVYSGNRLFAALQFTREATKHNSDIYLKSLKDLKLWLFNPMPVISPIVAFSACYITTPMSAFLYSAISLKYSRDKKGYVFDITTRDRLRVVG